MVQTEMKRLPPKCHDSQHINFIVEKRFAITTTTKGYNRLEVPVGQTHQLKTEPCKPRQPMAAMIMVLYLTKYKSRPSKAMGRG